LGISFENIDDYIVPNYGLDIKNLNEFVINARAITSI